MDMTTWWVWLAAALVLAILEVLVPGYILLGFAIGAALTGGVLFVAGPGFGLPALLVMFAVASLVAWLGLRHFFGLKTSGVQTFDHDINDG